MTQTRISPRAKRSKFTRLLLDWHKGNRQQYVWRLNPNPYKVLIAEILLQRTPAERVNRFLPTFLRDFPDPQSVASASASKLRDVLRPMGLMKRVSWIRNLMGRISELYDGKVPGEEDQLLALPGVGPYTARAVLSFGFEKRVPIVDVNVARVLSRVFERADAGRKPSEDSELWDFARGLLPEEDSVSYNEALLDLAKRVCKKRPLCDICPLTGICDYYEEIRGKAV